MRPKFYKKILMGYIKANSSDNFRGFASDFNYPAEGGELPVMAFIDSTK